MLPKLQPVSDSAPFTDALIAAGTSAVDSFLENIRVSGSVNVSLNVAGRMGVTSAISTTVDVVLDETESNFLVGVGRVAVPVVDGSTLSLDPSIKWKS